MKFSASDPSVRYNAEFLFATVRPLRKYWLEVNDDPRKQMTDRDEAGIFYGDEWIEGWSLFSRL